MNEERQPNVEYGVDEIIDKVEEAIIPIRFEDEPLQAEKKYRVLSLFSGCGGMDLGFEGHFIANKKSFAESCPFIDHQMNDNWVFLKKTQFQTIFANDILPEAEKAWTTYMSRFGYSENVYHNASIVELVKMHQQEPTFSPTTWTWLRAVSLVRISVWQANDKDLIRKRTISGKSVLKISPLRKAEASCISG